ncbi:hypothetical protein PC9H_005825 [Pleurotus ostreatus]|uniref:Uncharacterized protein n=1 Tax=Pleurotus ostreatus TaxID=5322 RepID=A0A8H6ZZR0_PLEOS|nr:uncharacterized protein PC9H_005825 [Pleurotus ostreatus]KAF7433859.1 hypothetical protein PC9H_005825 [Pleurotus ostreatus]KAJ8697338.1 hypothetical protein PTI98_004149 [Pleurotus ostreatus]
MYSEGKVQALNETWEGKSINLLWELTDMVNGWEDLFAEGDEACPAATADDEREAAVEQERGRLREDAGETWVPTANYEQVRRLMLHAYQKDEYATEKGRAQIIDNWGI